MDDLLQLLLADGIVDEVLGRLKSGKEAEIWLVRHGGETVAAKFYKDRATRSFKNNADYKEGRGFSNSRTQRAIDRGSRFGQAAAEEAWKSAEADALYKLQTLGVRVPTPVMYYEGVLLMQLVLDAHGQPAPRLIDVALTAQAAGEIYVDLRAQVVRMLDADLIHGDLSAYNVLVAAAGPTLIDFPQIVAAAKNSRSEFFFVRDLENLRNYLAGYDPALRARTGDAREIWRAYVRRELGPDFVPSGRVPDERHHRGQRPASHPPPAGQGRSVPHQAQASAKSGRPHPNQPAQRPGPVVVHVKSAAQPAEPQAPRRRRRRRRRSSAPGRGHPPAGSS